MLIDIKENQGIDMLQHLLSGYGRMALSYRKQNVS